MSPDDDDLAELGRAWPAYRIRYEDGTWYAEPRDGGHTATAPSAAALWGALWAAAAQSIGRQFQGRYDVGTTRTHAGISLEAVRRRGVPGPGPAVVITSDLGEMRAALAGDG